MTSTVVIIFVSQQSVSMLSPDLYSSGLRSPLLNCCRASMSVQIRLCMAMLLLSLSWFVSFVHRFRVCRFHHGVVLPHRGVFSWSAPDELETSKIGELSGEL